MRQSRANREFFVRYDMLCVRLEANDDKKCLNCGCCVKMRSSKFEFNLICGAACWMNWSFRAPAAVLIIVIALIKYD